SRFRLRPPSSPTPVAVWALPPPRPAAPPLQLRALTPRVETPAEAGSRPRGGVPHAAPTRRRGSIFPSLPHAVTPAWGARELDSGPQPRRPSSAAWGTISNAIPGAATA